MAQYKNGNMNIVLWAQMLPQSAAFVEPIGETGSEYFNEYAQVAVVRQESQST